MTIIIVLLSLSDVNVTISTFQKIVETSHFGNKTIAPNKFITVSKQNLLKEIDGL